MPSSAAKTLILAASLSGGSGGLPYDRPTMSPLPPYPDEAIGGSSPVGYLPGAAGVSASGRATYAVPLAVPDGTAGMQPELSLNYTSGGGNGQVGLGWSLHGASRIERCAKTLRSEGMVDGVNFDDDDALCFNGEKLVPVPHPAGTSPEFRTEADPFDRIVHDLDADTFRVWEKAGRIATFSAIHAWRMQSVDPNDAGNPAPDSEAPEPWRVDLRYSGQVVPMWVMTRMEDRRGNAVEYRYASPLGDDAEHADTEFWLSRVDYTSHGEKKATRRVELEYEPRDDVEVTYSAGVRYAQSRRLAMVSMLAPDSPDNAEPTLQWRYRLDYAYSPQSGRSTLTKVRQCDRADVCAWAKEFHWQHPQKGEPMIQASESWLSDPVYSPCLVNYISTLDDRVKQQPRLESGMPYHPIVLDADGDGRQDLIQVDTSAIGCDGSGLVTSHLYRSENAFAPTPWHIDLPNGTHLRSERMRVPDFDGDGADDLLVGLDVDDPSLGSNGGRYLLTVLRFDKATGHFKSVMAQEQKDQSNSGAFPGRWDLYEKMRWPLLNVMDADGDGLPDLVEGKHVRRNLGMSNGLIHFAPTLEEVDQVDLDAAPNQQIAWHWNAYNADAVAMDLDGDGRSELLLDHDPPSFDVSAVGNLAPMGFLFEYKALSLDTGGVEHIADVKGLQDGSSTIDVSTTSRVQQENMYAWISAYADINGDGLKDAVLVNYSHHWPYQRGTFIQWNTGRGFTRAVAANIPIGLLEALTPGPTITGLLARKEYWPNAIDVVDINHDGRDDLVVKSVVRPIDPDSILAWLDDAGDLHDASPLLGYGASTGTLDAATCCQARVYLSTGSGFTLIDRAFALGQFDHYNGYVTARPVNLDGNGDVQYLKVEDGRLKKVNLYAGPPEVILSVQDEGADHDRTIFTYKTWQPFTNDVACLYPLGCLSAFGTVVEQIATSHGQDRNGSIVYRRQQFEFMHPRVDRRGRGFLGFEIVKSTDWDSGAVTVTDYGVPEANGEFFPYTGIPKKVTSTAPILDAPDTGAANLGPGIVRARVSETINTRAMRSLYAGKAYFGYVTKSTTLVREQDVPLSLAMPSGMPVLDAPVHAQNDVEVSSATTTTTYDDYGNATDSTVDVHNGETRSRHATYDNLICYSGTAACAEGWRIGEQRRRWVTSLGRTREARYDYDDHGQVETLWIQPEDPDPDVRSTLHLVRDERGVVIQEAVSAPNVATRVTNVYYDADDSHVVQTINSLGHAASVLTHPGLGVPILAQDANGVIATRTYDGFGRPLGARSPVMPERTTNYAANIDAFGIPQGLLVTHSATDGAVDAVYSDEDGRSTLATRNGFQGEMLQRGVAYNLFGQVVRQYLPGKDVPSANAVVTSYDTLGRVRSVIAPDGIATNYEHAPFIETAIDQELNKRIVRFDAHGRPRSSEETLQQPPGPPKTLVTQFHYAAFDALDSTTDPDDHSMQAQYDVRGRKIWSSDPDAGVQRYAYDGLGQLREHVNANGHTIAHHYDALGRPVDIAESVGVTTFDWDFAAHGIGALAMAHSPDGVTVSAEYDLFGRPRETRWTIANPDNQPADTFALEQDYDAFGRTRTIAYPADPSNKRFGIEYHYNAHGYRDSVSRSTLEEGSKAVWTALERDEHLALTRSQFGNGLQSTFGYDPLNGMLQTIRTDYPLAPGGASPKFGVKYDYDDLRRVRTRTWLAQDATETFRYDSLDRLTGWDLGGVADAAARDYRYDDRGNLRSILLKNPQQPQGTVAYQADYGIGSHPNRLAGSTGLAAVAYDDAGNQTLANARIVTYDDANLPRTASQSGMQTWFRYGPDGGRVEKCGPMPGMGACAADADRTTYIGGLFERRRNGATTDYVFYVPGGNGTAAQVTRSITNGNGKVAEDIRYLERDHLGSASVAFGAAGDVETQLFDPWGKPFLHSGGALFDTLLTQGYTNQEHEPELGWINMGGRLYDPAQYRMVEADPLVSDPLFSQGRNRYSYVDNNPLRYTDPSGLGEVPAGSVTYTDTNNQPVQTLPLPDATVSAGLMYRQIARFTGGNLSDVSLRARRDAAETGGIVAVKRESNIRAGLRDTADRNDAASRNLVIDQPKYQDHRPLYMARIGDAATPNPGAAAVGIVRGIDAVDRFTDPAFKHDSARGVFEDSMDAVALVPMAALAAKAVSGKNCFVAGTLVQTPAGAKAIESIRVGDLVYARDENGDGVSAEKVLTTYRNRDKQTVLVTVADRNGKQEVIGASTEHPFHIDGHWVPASDLKPGDKVDRLGDGTLDVVRVEKEARRHDTFNFEVDRQHTYFVGALGAWVHNQSSLEGNDYTFRGDGRSPTLMQEQGGLATSPSHGGLFANDTLKVAMGYARSAAHRNGGPAWTYVIGSQDGSIAWGGSAPNGSLNRLYWQKEGVRSLDIVGWYEINRFGDEGPFVPNPDFDPQFTLLPANDNGAADVLRQ